jgi:hypothetical protein
VLDAATVTLLSCVVTVAELRDAGYEVIEQLEGPHGVRRRRRGSVSGTKAGSRLPTHAVYVVSPGYRHRTLPDIAFRGTQSETKEDEGRPPGKVMGCSYLESAPKLFPYSTSAQWEAVCNETWTQCASDGASKPKCVVLVHAFQSRASVCHVFLQQLLLMVYARFRDPATSLDLVLADYDAFKDDNLQYGSCSLVVTAFPRIESWSVFSQTSGLADWLDPKVTMVRSLCIACVGGQLSRSLKVVQIGLDFYPLRPAVFSLGLFHAMAPLYSLKPDSSHLITKDKGDIERAIAAQLPRQRTIPSDRGVALSVIADKLVRLGVRIMWCKLPADRGCDD